MPLRPSEEAEAGTAFHAQLLPDVDVSHFALTWHIFNVAHLLAVDLDRVTRRFGLSIADLYLLGTLRIDRPQPLRATDLALTLHVSNAVLSARVERLARAGLLERTQSAADKRAFDLQLTPAGMRLVEEAMRAIATQPRIVRHLAKLSREDHAALARIMGDLHTLLDRDFIAVSRGDD